MKTRFGLHNKHQIDNCKVSFVNATQVFNDLSATANCKATCGELLKWVLTCENRKREAGPVFNEDLYISKKAGILFAQVTKLSV